jgi:hypothetical protein
MAQATEISDPKVLETCLEDVVATRLIAPMEALKRNLKSSGLDAATAAICKMG